MPLLIDASINSYIFSVFLSLGNYFSIEKINLELIGRDDLREICRVQHYSCLYILRCRVWVMPVVDQGLSRIKKLKNMHETKKCFCADSLFTSFPVTNAHILLSETSILSQR